jgi:transposase-like protein
MSAKAKRPPAKSGINLSALAREHGVSRESLRLWALEGVNLSNPTEIAERRARMKTAAPPSIVAARIAKLELEAERLRLRVEAERGLLVSADEVQADARRIGCLVRQSLNKAASQDLPPLLAGRTAAEVSVLLARYFRDLCAALAAYQSPITQSIHD